MVNRFVKHILLLIILFFQFNLKLSANEREVLIINSYSPDFDWAVSAIHGVKSTVLENFPMAEFKVRYLNSEMFPNMQEWLDYIPKKIYRTETDKPVAIVLISDEAWLAYQLYYSKQFEGVPVFLCFVKPETICVENFTEGRSVEDYVVYPTLDLMNNYPSTAVFREVNIEGTVDLMERVVKGMDRIVLLGDKRYYASYIRYALDKYAKESNLNYTIENYIVGEMSKDNLLNQLSSLPKTTGVLLSMWQDGTHSYSYTRDNTYRKMSDNVNVPIFLTIDMGLNTGNFLGGVFLDSYFLGEKTGSQLVKLLRGRSIRSIDVETYTGKVPQVNWEVARSFGISKHELPDNTSFRFFPKKFTERISRELLIIVVSLIIVILVLIFALIFRKRYLSSYSKLKHEYDNLVLELSCCEAKIEESKLYREHIEHQTTIFLANMEYAIKKEMARLNSRYSWLSTLDFDVEQRRNLRGIDVSKNRFEYISNEGLELISLDSISVEPAIETLNLSTLCQEIIDDLLLICEDDVRLSFINLDPLFTVRSDRYLLGRMIESLLSHSIRMCNNGEIVLSCRRVSDNVMIGIKCIGDFDRMSLDDVSINKTDNIITEADCVGLAVLFSKVVARYIKAAVVLEDVESTEVFTIVIPVDYDTLV
ncbi:MAG: sensor histidine kinase [Bacteroidales bacterium]